MALDYQQLKTELQVLADAAEDVESLMSVIVGRLKEYVTHFDWVGFYMIEKGRLGEDDVLVVGPFVGQDTPHKRIPLNQGICGAAVTEGSTVIVDDVNADPRYLACSVATKSEIVTPIYVEGKVVGELDIDSHTPAAFTPRDRDLVEFSAQLVGNYLEKTT